MAVRPYILIIRQAEVLDTNAVNNNFIKQYATDVPMLIFLDLAASGDIFEINVGIC